MNYSRDNLSGVSSAGCYQANGLRGDPDCEANKKEICILLGVMAHLGFQVDYIQNQPKPKQLGILVRDFLDWVIWSGKTYPKSGPYLLVAVHIQGHGRRKLLPFAYLPSLLANLCVLLLRLSFTGARTCFFRIPTWTEDQLRHLASRSEWLPDFWTLPQETAFVTLAGPQSISHSDYIYILQLLKGGRTKSVIGILSLFFPSVRNITVWYNCCGSQSLVYPGNTGLWLGVGNGGPGFMIPLEGFACLAEKGKQSSGQGADPGLILNECWECGQAGREKASSSGDLGAALYYKGLSWQRSTMKR